MLYSYPRELWKLKEVTQMGAERDLEGPGSHRKGISRDFSLGTELMNTIATPEVGCWSPLVSVTYRAILHGSSRLLKLSECPKYPLPARREVVLHKGCWTPVPSALSGVRPARRWSASKLRIAKYYSSWDFIAGILFDPVTTPLIMVNGCRRERNSSPGRGYKRLVILVHALSWSLSPDMTVSCSVLLL